MRNIIISTAVLSLSLFCSSASAQDKPKDPDPKSPVIEGVLRSAIARIAVPEGIPEAASISLEIEGKRETLVLTRTSLRTAKAKLYLDRGGGRIEEAPLPPHRTYRGIVQSTGTLVSASIIDGKLWAMVDMPGDTVFVQPMSDFRAGAPREEHVVFRHSAVVPFGDHRCGNDETKLALPDWMMNVPTDPADGGGMAPPEGGVAGTTPFIAEIAFDADYEFFLANLSSAINVVNDIENVMNNVSLVYDRDVNISYEFSAFVVRTTAADPYTTTVMTDLLCEFRNKWNTTPENQILRDVAQLYTGKAITGNVIGLAWLGVLCNQVGTDCASTGNLAYSCVESRFTTNLDFRTSLSAHEIGHNWQAQHCDATNPCNIMCSIINSCQGTTGANLRFATSEQTQITNFRNAVSCDPALPAPIALPFTDDFEVNSINTAKWLFNKGAALSTAAVGEPSPTRSLNLDSANNLDYGDDEIRTNYMLLAGLSTVFVQYSTEHIGVESGKQLVVEYLNTSLDWTLLNTITASGIDQSAFTAWQHTLPANAKHNKFRLRFRTVGDAPDDDWYIDDVRVVSIIVPSNDECAAAIAVGEGSVAFDTTNATDSAVALPVACNDGAGSLMKNDIWYLYTPTCSGNATASTCGTAAFDTRLAAYGFVCPPGGGILACDDNTGTCAGNTTSITFPVGAGLPYFIRVGGPVGGGTGTLTISCAPQLPCDADLDGDGSVTGGDLSLLLNSWSTGAGDINGDGLTDGGDLALLLNSWGPCP